MDSRPGWDEYGLGMAAAASVRGDCRRRRVGAVVLDANHRIAGAGYNGHEPGGPSCLAGDCPRGRHYYVAPGPATLLPRCGCGDRWPCPEAAAPGSSYDTTANPCRAVHAEMNAILDVSDRRRLDRATLYVTTEPCQGCRNIIRGGTAIAAIVWPKGSWNR